MSDTAVGAPDPDEPQPKRNVGPRLGVNERGYPTDETVKAFHRAIMPKSTNGRLNGDSWGYDVPSRPNPLITVQQKRQWRERVRANIVRREEMIKGLPAMLKERARVKVYDYIFGWILDDPTPVSQTALDKHPAAPRDDVHLFL